MTNANEFVELKESKEPTTKTLKELTLLAPGTVKFSTLNDACIIMITPFDLFGAG